MKQIQYPDRCRFSMTSNRLKRWWHRNCIVVIAITLVICLISSYVVLGATINHQKKTIKYLEAYTERFNTVMTIDIKEPEKYYFEVPLSEELQDYIRELCLDYNVPMALVIALIDHESSFNPDAISRTDDYGLMQINKINHKTFEKTYGYTDFLNPEANVHCGIVVISQGLIATEGNIELALMRYNMGPSGAKKQWDKGVYSNAYSQKVMNLYNYYSELERSFYEELSGETS